MIDTSTFNVAALGGAASLGTVSEKPGTTLDKDDFLRLLITQLRHQNPLQPVDQTEFLSQTAQFTSLEQLTNINKTLQEMRSIGGDGSGVLSAAALIGRTVRLAGRSFESSAGGAVLPFTLDGPATRVALDVIDKDGNLLRRLDLGARAAGAHESRWDGRDSAGRPVTAGTYFFKVAAEGRPGGPVPVAVAAEGPVTGVTTENGRVYYRLGDTVARLEDVIDVR
jgi:flagellar basal-body rod modification protein FlgD